MSETRKRHTAATLAKFVERHGVEDLSAFWWIENGFGMYDEQRWRTRSYRVVLLAVHEGKRGARRSEAAEFSAESAEALHDLLAAEGYEPPSVAEIERLCRSAPRSPEPPRSERRRARHV